MPRRNLNPLITIPTMARATETNRMLTIPSLNGIRALAVMLVFIAHAGFAHVVPGGFGVTVFFFLSGYLITTLMRVERESTGRISYKNFYLRRIYRIFPPLYIVLLITISLQLLSFSDHDIKCGGVLASLFHVTNYYLIFAQDPQLIPGTHVLWSLAVEEHYYLLFPFLFSFLATTRSYLRMASILLMLCAVVLVWRCYLVFGLGILQPHTYMATDTRMDSIIFGCIMGLVCNPALDKTLPFKQMTEIFVFAVAIIVLLLCLIFRSQVFRETFRYTLQGLALFPIFYLAVKRSNWIIFAPLNWKPTVALGTISYTFYLFHPTSIILAERVFDNQVIERMIFSFVITTLFSTLMYLFVEKRFSALRRKLHSHE